MFLQNIQVFLRDQVESFNIGQIAGPSWFVCHHVEGHVASGLRGVTQHGYGVICTWLVNLLLFLLIVLLTYQKSLHLLKYTGVLCVCVLVRSYFNRKWAFLYINHSLLLRFRTRIYVMEWNVIAFSKQILCIINIRICLRFSIPELDLTKVRWWLSLTNIGHWTTIT